MVLKSTLYRILQQSSHGEEYSFELELNRDHIIYQSHFPGFPVTPAVTQLHIIKELFSEVLKGSWKITSITNSKFLKIINPEEENHIRIQIDLSSFKASKVITAQISGNNVVYSNLKFSVSD